jgi:hypothetical protein
MRLRCPVHQNRLSHRIHEPTIRNVGKEKKGGEGGRFARLPASGGALSFSLNEDSMGAGKVFPRSQMSMSFLIFAYGETIREFRNTHNTEYT